MAERAKAARTRKTPAKRAPARKPAAKKPAGKSGVKARAPRNGGSPKREVAAKRKSAASKRADEAAALAKAKGATGAFGPSAQRALRDSAVVARIESGSVTRAQVAKEFDISVRTVDDILSKRRAGPSPIDEMPMDILEGLARDYKQATADFQAFAHAHAESAPAVAVSALKGALQSRERYLELLSAVGKLPSNLELFRAESVLRQIADQMFDVMEQVEAGEMSPADAAEFFRSIVVSEDSTRRKAIGAGG